MKRGMLVMGGLLAGLLALMARARANNRLRNGSDLQLSKNFRLSEFLRSGVAPDLQYYVPTRNQLANLQALVTKVLQPLRDKFGPVSITNGGRPLEFRAKNGKSIDQLLRDAGYNPSPDSDHHEFAGADLRVKADMMTMAYEWLQLLPDVRQVILYMRDGRPDHIHVAVKHPEKPNRAEKFAFVDLGPKKG